LLNVFVDEVRTLGRRNGLRVISLAPSTLKKHITGNGRASKAEVARVVVAKYPELRVYLSQDRKWKERYHGNMFDAVALGLMCRNWLSE
jgi:Holliday junction resolvasome RuvABC endonuclease subunit